MSIQMNTITSKLSSLSLEELQELNSAVVDQIKVKRKSIARIKRNRFAKNERVVILENKEDVLRGEILKINRTRARVRIDGEGLYNVPLTMLESELVYDQKQKQAS